MIAVVLNHIDSGGYSGTSNSGGGGSCGDSGSEGNDNDDRSSNCGGGSGGGRADGVHKSSCPQKSASLFPKPGKLPLELFYVHLFSVFHVYNIWYPYVLVLCSFTYNLLFMWSEHLKIFRN